MKKLSANTVAIISCKSRLTKVCVGAARGREKGSNGGGDRVRLLVFDTRMSDLSVLPIH